MKKILTMVIILLLFPINVSAEEITLHCSDSKLKNNQETECQIKVSNLSYNATNISGEITISDNLKIIYSSYDDKNWKMLDKEFDVKSINLISENKHNGRDFIIATFKVKAINKENSSGEINFINVEIGDENYEGHTLEPKETTIELTYNMENEIKNKKANNIKMVIPLAIIIALLGYFGLKNKKKNIKE